jgi:hypothetical protein
MFTLIVIFLSHFYRYYTQIHFHYVLHHFAEDVCLRTLQELVYCHLLHPRTKVKKKLIHFIPRSMHFLSTENILNSSDEKLLLLPHLQYTYTIFSSIFNFKKVCKILEPLLVLLS